MNQEKKRLPKNKNTKTNANKYKGELWTAMNSYLSIHLKTQKKCMNLHTYNIVILNCKDIENEQSQ